MRATARPTHRCGRAAARTPHGVCDFPVDPEIEAPAAPVFWLPAEAPAAVGLIASLPGVGIAAQTLATIPVICREDDESVAWLRLESGTQLVGEIVAGAAPLGILLPLDEAWPARLAAAERLRRELSGLQAKPSLTPQSRERLKRAIRTVDGRRQGASYRAVAIAFFGEQRIAGEHWKTSALKAQVARLAAHGRMLIDRGYRDLLRSGRPGS